MKLSLFDFGVDRNVDFNQNQDMTPHQETQDQTLDEQSPFALDHASEIRSDTEESQPYIQPLTNEDSGAYDPLTDLLDPDEENVTEDEYGNEEDESNLQTQDTRSNVSLIVLLLLLLLICGATYWQYPELFHNRFISETSDATTAQGVKLTSTPVASNSTLPSPPSRQRPSQLKPNLTQTNPAVKVKTKVSRKQKSSDVVASLKKPLTDPSTSKRQKTNPVKKSTRGKKRAKQDAPRWYQVNKALKERFVPEKKTKTAFNATLNTPSSLDIIHFRDKAKELKNKKTPKSKRIEMIARGLLHFNHRRDPLQREANSLLQSLTSQELKSL